MSSLHVLSPKRRPPLTPPPAAAAGRPSADHVRFLPLAGGAGATRPVLSQPLSQSLSPPLSQPLSPPVSRLSEAKERLLRPAVGFTDPLEVLKDPHLDRQEKRAILSSWASDACAVEDQPQLRWLIGTDAPVRLEAVLEALDRLDRLN